MLVIDIRFSSICTTLCLGSLGEESRWKVLEHHPPTITSLGQRVDQPLKDNSLTSTPNTEDGVMEI